MALKYPLYNCHRRNTLQQSILIVEDDLAIREMVAATGRPIGEIKKELRNLMRVGSPASGK